MDACNHVGLWRKQTDPMAAGGAGAAPNRKPSPTPRGAAAAASPPEGFGGEKGFWRSAASLQCSWGRGERGSEGCDPPAGPWVQFPIVGFLQAQQWGSSFPACSAVGGGVCSFFTHKTGEEKQTNKQSFRQNEVSSVVSGRVFFSMKWGP